MAYLARISHQIRAPSLDPTRNFSPSKIDPAIMSDNRSSSRERIVEAANQLFYHLGYNQTSFGAIANAAGIPKGNFYYYFKSKDELLEAVVDHRTAEIRAMLEGWNQTYSEPIRRLKRFVQILRNSAEHVTHYGCPLGTLNSELGKDQPGLKSKSKEMFDLFHEWLQAQFLQLGYRKDKANELAKHLLARSQGISILAHVYNDSKFLRREVAMLDEWLDSLA